MRFTFYSINYIKYVTSREFTKMANFDRYGSRSFVLIITSDIKVKNIAMRILFEKQRIFYFKF